jgi:hypothetical protein
LLEKFALEGIVYGRGGGARSFKDVVTRRFHLLAVEMCGVNSQEPARR